MVLPCEARFWLSGTTSPGRKVSFSLMSPVYVRQEAGATGRVAGSPEELTCLGPAGRRRRLWLRKKGLRWTWSVVRPALFPGCLRRGPCTSASSPSQSRDALRRQYQREAYAAPRWSSKKPWRAHSVDLCRSAVAMGLARTVVEFVGDGVQVGLAERAEVGALGQVLPKQPVGVLVGAALPRARAACRGRSASRSRR